MKNKENPPTSQNIPKHKIAGVLINLYANPEQKIIHLKVFTTRYILWSLQSLWSLNGLRSISCLKSLQVLVALVALLGPAVLAEPVIVVQPLKPTVPAELAEPEPLPDQECSVEPIFKKAVPQAL